MSPFFDFETDFVDSLRCIPMQVRLKLDTCGVKLKLSHWSQFSQTERQALVTRPCETDAEGKDYREFLQGLITEKTGSPASELPIDPSPPWKDSTTIPASVAEKAAELEVSLTQAQWQALSPLQRFTLIKLSRPGHENRNFQPAFKEFKLL